MFKKLSYKEQRGFSLIEIVVALTIAAVALPALLRAFSEGAKKYSLIENKTTAIYLLKLKMAEIETQGYPEVGTEEGEFGTNSRFGWITEIAESDTDGLREVKVTVHWQEKGQEKSIVLDTYMSDRSIQQDQQQQDQQTQTQQQGGNRS